MNNLLQEQLLKAGLVTKQQVQKANKEKGKKKKQLRTKNENSVDPVKLKAKRIQQENAQRDRELNKKREDQARKKAISLEINRLVTENRVQRDNDRCDIVYNFEHNGIVKRIYVDNDMKQQIIQGRLGIARIEGRYELVSRSVAEKIQQKNPKRIVIFDGDKSVENENDPYSEYKVPDDLMW